MPVTKLNVRTPKNIPPWQPPEPEQEEELPLDTKRDKINKMNLALFNQSEALTASKKLDKTLKDIISTLQGHNLLQLKAGSDMNPSLFEKLRDSEESQLSLVKLYPMPTLGAVKTPTMSLYKSPRSTRRRCEEGRQNKPKKGI